MWGGRAVLHKVKTLQLRARCGNAAAGREGLCRGENDEGKSWEMRREQGEMRRKQGETKIPQSRGACGTRGGIILYINHQSNSQSLFLLRD